MAFTVRSMAESGVGGAGLAGIPGALRHKYEGQDSGTSQRFPSLSHPTNNPGVGSWVRLVGGPAQQMAAGAWWGLEGTHHPRQRSCCTESQTLHPPDEPTAQRGN